MSQDQTIKEGLLYKRGKINTDWKQRLFILNGKQLAYFKGSKHCPSGVIELKEVRQISQLQSSNMFTVETPSRIYEIRGDTTEISQAWIDAINNSREKL